MELWILIFVAVAFCLTFATYGQSVYGQTAPTQGLVLYWKLQGDCRDYSGRGNHGVNYGVNLETGEFNGKNAYIEAPNGPLLNFGTGDFSICAAVYTHKDLEDVVGDVANKFDPERRKGFTLGIKASSPGYSSQGDDRHVYFGIDNGKESGWTDCGRPMLGCNFVNGLTVFNGDLYVANTDGPTEADWCHVFRYSGGGKWEDCGRVGSLRTTGVTPMIVHNGELYAVTHNFGQSTRGDANLDKCRVYRYKGGKEWEDCGLGEMRRLWGIASYKGRLYVVGDDMPYKWDKSTHSISRCYVYEGGKEWKVCREFRTMTCTLAVHDGKLYAADNSVAVEAYDGEKWESVGPPVPMERWSQVHCMEPYRGALYAGTWPLGLVGAYRDGEWEDCGGFGYHTEVFSFTVYNGKLYTGTIPYAEVFRYEGGKVWTPMIPFLAGPVLHLHWGFWARATSMTVYDGKLFVSIGSGTSNLRVVDSPDPVPCDNRGKVFCFEAGKNISYDRDLGFGWQHIAAVKEGGALKLYVNGELAVASPSPFDPKEYDLSNEEPLQIGSGGMDYFWGKMRDVRVYSRAISDQEAKQIYGEAKGVMAE